MAFSRTFGWSLVLVTGVLFACSENSPSVNPADKRIPKGKELYLLHCASCHGEAGDLGVSGAKNLKITTLDINEIKTILANGKNAMPAFKTILGSQGNIDSVAIYVTTLHN